MPVESAPDAKDGRVGVPIRSALRHLDPEEIRELVRVETRNREVHLPPVSAYRWWARRTESINGAIIDAFEGDRGSNLLISDPFAGGGVIPLAVVLRGHRLYAQDLNPWAAEGLATMLRLAASHEEIAAAATRLGQTVQPLIDKAYGTTFSDGEPAEISHTFRVASACCTACGRRERLYPHALVSLKRRKERDLPEAFLACAAGHLFEGRNDREQPCPECRLRVAPEADYTRGRVLTCQGCGHLDKIDDRAAQGDWRWDVALVERSAGRRRELAVPTASEIAQASDTNWPSRRRLPAIPKGRETGVLLRHGFVRWSDLYPARQRYVLDGILKAIPKVTEDLAAREALQLAVVGSTEMAGLLSRWDRFYLKSYESMAGHRFNFTTFPAEPNVWGATASGRGTVSRRLRLLAKASDWFFEHTSGVEVEGALRTSRGRARPLRRGARIVEGSSERQLLPAKSVDLVLTDPPYHDDVQYGELSLPLRAWAGQDTEDLGGEALVNGTGSAKDSAADYEGLLARIFTETRRTLRDDGHLVFSYANRDPAAWVAVFGALERAGFRAVGYSVLHSENETDWAKRNVRACTLDLLMDLAPLSERPIEQWLPSDTDDTPEEDFLLVIGATFLRIGDLGDNWRDDFVAAIRATAFLESEPAKSAASDADAVSNT